MERAIFKLQEGICRGFREFLIREEFTEIHTPKIVQSGAEGGANIFKLDYFGQDAYLAQSPQFYKQMMVGAFERVFEIAPVFRAEKHDTSRHLNEYTSVDFEMGFIENFEEIMQMETRMLRYTCDFLRQNYKKELELLKVTLPVITEIPSISFREAKELVAKEYKRNIPAKSVHFMRRIVRKILKKPKALTCYSVDLKLLQVGSVYTIIRSNWIR